MANTRSIKTQIATDSKRFQELKADLARIEYFSKGTVLARMIKVRQAEMPLRRRSQKTARPLFRVDLQRARQDC